ncbi:probable G-protein coupled receptor 139 [Pristis pectinata]|uniref:probable G-protein coupled receptor 139 n=1 Tax=Pristis pectinata TaxID=685728 RepID=UPI00223DD7FD|nr:probable G-protein coupled receptor 139 [Pristis pectinata]
MYQGQGTLADEPYQDSAQSQHGYTHSIVEVAEGAERMQGDDSWNRLIQPKTFASFAPTPSIFLPVANPIKAIGTALDALRFEARNKFNFTAIVILSRGKCGLSKCITRYLEAMAAADLMLVVVAVIVEQINYIYLFANFLFVTPVCSVILVLRIAISDCSVWLTVVFTLDRYVAICCQKLRKRYCTETTATLVIVTVCAGSCARAIPFYFTVDPWRCVSSAEYLTSPVWRAYQLCDGIVTPVLQICLILLFNTLTVRHIIAANKVRQGLRNNSENQKNAEMDNCRKSIILLFALSANFILLWTPNVVHTMNWQAENYSYTDRYFNTPVYILQQFGYMLQFISTCTNTCFYGLTQRKFREELKNGVKYLFAINGRLLKFVSIVILDQ